MLAGPLGCVPKAGCLWRTRSRNASHAELICSPGRSSDLLAGLRESWGARSEEEAETEGRWLGLTALLALASFIPSTPKSIGEARRSWLTKDCALPVPHSCNCSRNALLAPEGFQIAGSGLAGKGSFTVARTWASLIPPTLRPNRLPNCEPCLLDAVCKRSVTGRRERRALRNRLALGWAGPCAGR